MSGAETEASQGRRFHLKALIGQGSFGEVYLAEQDSGSGFSRRVALKLLHGHLERSEEISKRMRDEARMLGRLQHKNIVAVLDLLQLEERWAIVMDYVPGADLGEVLELLAEQEASFPAPAALEIGAAIFEALDFAFHFEDSKGRPLHVVHRDIKPSNVRLSKDGQPKVLDFGVARVDLDQREAQTKKPMWLGTERYMSPERILRERDDETGDVYATAATVVELLRGEPFGRTPVMPDRHEEHLETIMVIVRERLQGPDEVVDSVCSILRRALHHEPDERPTHREIEEVLREGARRLEGESLLPFTRRIVPVVEERMAANVSPATGSLDARTLLSSGSTTRSGLTPAVGAPPPRGAGQTWTPDMPPPDDSGVSDFVTSDTEELLRRQSGLLAGAAAFIGVSLLAVALSIFVVGVLLRLPSGDEAERPDGAAAAGLEAQGVEASGAGEAPVVEPSGSGVETPDEPMAGGTDEVSTPDEAAASDEAAAGGQGTEEPPAEATTEAAPSAEPSKPTGGTGATTSGAGTVASSATAGSGDTTAAETTPAPAPRGEVVRRAIVALPNASKISVDCGGVVARGTSSASISGFTAGSCLVTVDWLGDTLTTSVDITRPAEVRCTVADGRLACS